MLNNFRMSGYNDLNFRSKNGSIPVTERVWADSSVWRICGFPEVSKNFEKG